MSDRSCGIDGCRQAWLDDLHSLICLFPDAGRPQNRRTRNPLRRRCYRQISPYHSHRTPGNFDQECPTCRYGYSGSEGQNYCGHSSCLARRQETRRLPANHSHLDQQHGDRCYQGVHPLLRPCTNAHGIPGFPIQNAFCIRSFPYQLHYPRERSCRRNP